MFKSLRRNSTRLCSRCASKLIARIFSEVGFIVIIDIIDIG